MKRFRMVWSDHRNPAGLCQRPHRTAGSGRRQSLRARADAGAGPQEGSERELVHVRLVEHLEWAEDDLTVLADGVVAELAGGELVPLGSLDVAIHQRLRGVRRQVAEILGVPEAELFDDPAVHVVLQLTGQTEAGQPDLALVLR